MRNRVQPSLLSRSDQKRGECCNGSEGHRRTTQREWLPNLHRVSSVRAHRAWAALLEILDPDRLQHLRHWRDVSIRRVVLDTPHCCPCPIFNSTIFVSMLWLHASGFAFLASTYARALRTWVNAVYLTVWVCVRSPVKVSFVSGCFQLPHPEATFCTSSNCVHDSESDTI